MLLRDYDNKYTGDQIHFHPAIYSIIKYDTVTDTNGLKIISPSAGERGERVGLSVMSVAISN